MEVEMSVRNTGGVGVALALGIALGFALASGARASTADVVRYFPHTEVEQAFAQGRPLVELESFKVHASRRTEAGKAEVHERETDVIYVLQGRATLVTGGQVVAGKPIGPGEIRGEAIAGGASQGLTPGDVMIVPAGLPHWFQTVEAPFLYYVVKVVEPQGGGR
jgi:mannose-6-phosphate isomerase-like protein (cupin superfamily)